MEAAGGNEDQARRTRPAALAATLLGYLPSCSEGSFLPPVWKKTTHCLEEDNGREAASEEGGTFEMILGLDIGAFASIE